tara:strand:- start:780 stop:983 length:204 start_codon:yes stop_codon:yes gene_type:complete
MKYDVTEMARINGLSKDEFIDEICQQFIALMDMKMDEQDIDAVMLRFGEFTVVTRKVKGVSSEDDNV